MPTYDYQCVDCSNQFEVFKPISKSTTLENCPKCSSSNTKKVFAVANFTLKGDGWPGKNNLIKKQMAQKNKRLKGKEEQMKRDAPGVKLAPNVNGERVDSWAEAKKLASSQGLNASSYDTHIREAKKLEKKPDLA